MNYARWYPSLATLGNGDVEVFGGVTKLVKPVYPADPLTSGQNVVNTETFHLYDGTWTGQWRRGRSGRCRCSPACICCPTAR